MPIGDYNQPYLMPGFQEWGQPYTPTIPPTNYAPPFAWIEPIDYDKLSDAIARGTERALRAVASRYTNKVLLTDPDHPQHRTHGMQIQ